MISFKDAVIAPSATIFSAIKLLCNSNMRICLVVDDEQRLIGTVTDGDIRRGIMRSIPFTAEVQEIMFKTPRSASPDDSAAVLLERMTSERIYQMPLLDSDGRVIGLTTMEELVGARTLRKNWVVLMAGGLGSRLMPLTEKTPKPMLNVGGKPVLETIIETFIRHEFRHFYISVNYKAEAVMEYFKDGQRWNIEIRYLREDQALGTAGPLALIPEKPGESVIVMNGDLITRINFHDLMDYHAQHASQATMCVREYDFQVPFGVVNIENGRIKHIDEKPVHKFFVNAGIYVLEPDLIDLVKAGQRLDMTELFDQAIRAGETTSAFPIHEYWLDIGRADDLARARVDFHGRESE